MTRLLRTFPAIALAVLLALTSQTMATARGAPAPVGQAVLCTGMGPVTVLVDAQGQPTGKVHICPDCAFGPLYGVLTLRLDLTLPDHASAGQPTDFTKQKQPLAPAAFAARAPPEAV